MRGERRASIQAGRTYHRAVGFNPFRKKQTSLVDVVIVVGFAILIAAFLAWGFLG